MVQWTKASSILSFDLGLGLLSQFSPFRYFPNFSEWWKQWLPEWYHVHIWQVSPQLSCGDTWQIWTWLKVSNLYFCKIKISRDGEINERSLSNPHPWLARTSRGNDQRAINVHADILSLMILFQWHIKMIYKYIRVFWYTMKVEFVNEYRHTCHIHAIQMLFQF